MHQHGDWRHGDGNRPEDRQSYSTRAQRETCEAYLGMEVVGKVGLILTADPGDFSGTSEAFHILANLQDKQAKARDETVCGNLFTGTLMGQAVVVGTTGIGPTAAGLCTLELMTACGPFFSDMVYFGTSGWSPALGGILNPANCSGPNTNNRVTRVGDVCVSPWSVDWVCKKSSWSSQAAGWPNQCFRPNESQGPNATYLYGECQFYADNMDANLELAESILGASASARGRRNFPARSGVVAGLEATYWDLMSKGTKHAYPTPNAQAEPALWDYTQCMETDSQFFYTGVPWEITARDYAAQTINAALQTDKDMSQVIAVSAMEGVGVGEAMEKYHRLRTTRRRVPYTHIRTLSNYMHHPVTQKSAGMWDIYQEVPEDYVNGYAYAIATGSAVILNAYQERCATLQRAGALAEDVQCSFTISYQ